MYKQHVKTTAINIDATYIEDKSEFASEYTGFDFNIPVEFILDTVNVVMFHSLNKLTKDAFIILDDISQFFLSIPEFIWAGVKQETNIFYKSLYLLKYFSTVIDFEVIKANSLSLLLNKDKNILDKLEFSIDIPLKFKDDLNFTVNVLNLLNSHLSVQLQDQSCKNKCFGYKKITNMKKSMFARPDFIYQLVKESSFVEGENTVEKPVLIFVEDTSSSMSEGKSKLITDIIRFYLSTYEHDIHYFTESDGIIEFKKIFDNKEQFFSNVTYKRDYFNYDKILKTVSSKYKNQTVLLLTDGKDKVPTDLTLNNKLVVLNTNLESISIKKLCKLNNGVQICL